MLDNVALITGGSSGIGAEFANQLAARGYNLLLVSNQPELLAERQRYFTEAYPQLTCLIMNIDLSTLDAADRVEQYCRERDIVVEVLVNNSGVFDFKQVADLTAERLDLYINLHIRCVTHLCRIFAAQMTERGRGYILNMSSMSCWMPMPGIAMYSATKAYIRVFGRALHYELKDKGVAVLTCCPGGISTTLFGLKPSLRKLGVTLGVLATPQRFVKGALKRLFRKRKQYINGLLNRISIFTIAILPTWFIMWAKHISLDKPKTSKL